MLIYLDSNIVIYLIEQVPGWLVRVTNRLAIAHAQGDQLVISDLTRLECRVGPLSSGDMAILAKFDAFFTSSGIQVVPLTGAICDRAAFIRAQHRYRLGDAINLAAAVEAGCDVFLTNDGRLSKFTDLTVEILP